MATAKFKKQTVIDLALDWAATLISQRDADREAAYARLKLPRKTWFGLYSIMSITEAWKLARAEVPYSRDQDQLDRINAIIGLAEASDGSIMLDTEDARDLGL